MLDIIKIKDLVFKYDSKLIFNRFNVNIKKNKLTTIVGLNGSGKTTLVKILCGLYKFDGYINIDGIRLEKEHLTDIKMKLGVVLKSNSHFFVAETVTDELAFMLENLCYPKKDIEKEINRVSKLLDIKRILSYNPNSLNTEDKTLVSLACALIINPKIIVIDESLDVNDKKEQLLKKLKNQKNLTIINTASNLDDILISDEVIILKDGQVYMQGKPKDILKDEQKLQKANFKLPFMLDLSKKLQFYKLIDQDFYDMKDLINSLWK